jgi:hypothetical protein
VSATEGVAFGTKIAYNFHMKERVNTQASFNEDYVAARRHMNP